MAVVREGPGSARTGAVSNPGAGTSRALLSGPPDGIRPGMSTVVLNGRLSADEVVAIAGGSEVGLAADALERVERNRRAFARLVERGTPIYGVTTGHGALVLSEVPREHQRQSQANLLRSHAAGAGEELPDAVVRAALGVRLNGLLRGHSGIRPLVLRLLADLLNAGLIPCVPRTGSLGASGDLAPSAHAFLPLIGEGTVRAADGRRLTGAEALRELDAEPLVLEAKEALALINGTHFMAGIGALLVVRVRRLLDVADLVAATTIDALHGALAPFDSRVHRLRGIAGQRESAAIIAAALRGSDYDRGGDESLQDAYSLRCAAQIHGSAREAWGFFGRLVAAEVNAVTDNPVVFRDEVISAGNFHGQALALAFDTLRLALADLGSVAERRTFRLLSPSLNGALPAFLSPSPGPANGYMIVQYVSAALLSELRALAHPVSIDNVPTSDNQEDHVSMGMTGALLALQAVERVERIVAGELLCACQAIDCRPDPPAPAVARVHALVRERVAPLEEDRPPADDVAALLPLVQGDELARLAEER
jgi:histidine ammonia-lyase